MMQIFIQIKKRPSTTICNVFFVIHQIYPRHLKARLDKNMYLLRLPMYHQ